MFFHKISIANINIELSTNDILINEHILKNYTKSNVNTINKTHIHSHNSILDLKNYILQKHKINIHINDSFSRNIETRIIGKSFISRISCDNASEIHYYNDTDNDIMELVFSTMEYTIFKFLPEGSIVLHASMVEYKDQAIIFSGKSGAGKTTMALISHEHGANIIENEHTIFQSKDDLVLYKTSSCVRVKKNVMDETKKIINYNNIETIACKKHYKRVTIVFLEFGKRGITTLNINEAIGNFLENIIRYKQDNAIETINSIKELVLHKKTRVMKGYIENKNYTSSQDVVKELIRRIDYENGKV